MEPVPQIFNIVFFIVLSSVLTQGTTIPYAARRLRVSAPVTPRPTAPLEFVETGGNDVELHQFVIQSNSPVVGRRLVELGLADGTLVVLISREGQYLIPQGATVLDPGDTVLVLAGSDALPDMRALFEGG
jgi:cell volume regulation protein A